MRVLHVARSTPAAPHPAAALLLLLGAAIGRRQMALRQEVQGGGLLVRYVPNIRSPHTSLLGEKRPSKIRYREGRARRQEDEDDQLKTLKIHRDVRKNKAKKLATKTS